MYEVDLAIRQIREEEVNAVHAALSPNSLVPLHQDRFEVQERGEGMYLIAWFESKPIGHLLIRFAGPDTDPSKRYPYPTAYVEGIETQKEFRRKGVATSMIHNAEQMLLESGKSVVGLTVGADDNPDARRLYEKLGYQNWGLGEFTVSWEFNTKNGNKGTQSEVCIYMFKQIE